MLKLPFSPAPALVIVSLLGLGCPTKDLPDEASDGAVADAGDAESRPKLPPPTRKVLGAACSGTGDCESGFCVDGVCCESACDASCLACNQSAASGSCRPLVGEDDLSPASSCTGSRTCAADTSGAVACRLKDGEACLVPADCASGSCRTYYVDQDADGYGADSTDTIVRCDATPRPPQGFAAAGGDCCDVDPGANPGLPATSYFTTKDRCGNYDWNCSGGEERQSTTTCPTATSLGCGQACTIVFKQTASVLFVQACH